MPAHNLKHERTRMRYGSRVDVINRLANPMQGRRCTDCKVRHGHIIVYRANKPDNPEMRMLLSLLFRDLPCVSVLSACNVYEDRH